MSDVGRESRKHSLVLTMDPRSGSGMTTSHRHPQLDWGSTNLRLWAPTRRIKTTSIRLNLEGCLTSDVKVESIRYRSYGSPIGVGDDVVLKERGWPGVTPPSWTLPSSSTPNLVILNSPTVILNLIEDPYTTG